jgi:hypothetical protein
MAICYNYPSDPQVRSICVIATTLCRSLENMTVFSGDQGNGVLQTGTFIIVNRIAV